MEQIPKNRIGYIDALRGMAMILVVYFHIAAYGFGSYEIGYNDIIERFRMPTFFFISGWLFYKAGRIWNREAITGMIRKKFMVQVVPTAVFMLLYLTMFNLMDVSSFGSDKKGYWFTFVLFEYFVIYIMAEALFNRQSSTKGEMRVLVVMLIFSICAFYYAKYYTRYAVELGVWKDFLGFISFVKIRHIIFFWMGTFVRRHFDQFIHLTNNRYVTAIPIGLFTAIIVWPTVLSINGVEYIAYLVAGVSGTIIFHGTHSCLLGSYHQPPDQQHSQSESITGQVLIWNQIDFVYILFHRGRADAQPSVSMRIVQPVRALFSFVVCKTPCLLPIGS